MRESSAPRFLRHRCFLRNGTSGASFRFSFSNEAQIWYSRDPEHYPVSDQFENVIVLSDEFYQEVVAHLIPADLQAVNVLGAAPAVLDLFMCRRIDALWRRGMEDIPLFGPYGLANQIGSTGYARPRRSREKLDEWLDSIRLLWPECPARISLDGTCLTVERGYALLNGKGERL